jgi:hypothetical protein
MTTKGKEPGNGGNDRRNRSRALKVTAAITLGSLALLADLILVGHTKGEEIWGVLVAASSVLVGTLSFVYLATSRRSRAARIGIILLWGTVAFFGYGGYNDHRLPRPADTISDQRTRPPLAPLTFTAFGIAGAIALHKGSKGARISLVAQPDLASGSDPR